ncbi:MAG: glycosyltransferase family 25 protein [bacterium]
MIKNSVDKIFTINLDYRTDRWDHIQKEFKKLGIDNYERFSAIKPDLKNINPYFYRNFSLAGKDKNKYKQACHGTKISQLSCMWYAKIKNKKSLLIIQDDAVFRENTNKIFDKAINELKNIEWDVLYLTLNHRETPIKVSNHVVKVTGGFSSLAYITKPNMWNVYLEKALLSGKEMDVFAKDYIQKNYKCYCITPNLAMDIPGYSDILQGKRNYKKVFGF